MPPKAPAPRNTHPTAHDEMHRSVPAAKPKPVKVMATALCYINEQRRRTGDVFFIPGDVHPPGHKKAGQLVHLAKAMQIVGAREPLKDSTPNSEIARKHDEILGKRMSGEEVVGNDGDDERENPIDA